MSVIPSDPALVQLLNCTKGYTTTISALYSFASNPNWLIILLQEPTIEYTKLPPTHPEFHLLTPVPEQPLYATYIYCLPGIQIDITFSHSNSFLGTLVSFPNCPALTIYNFYSPGRPHEVMELLPDLCPNLPAIIMGDLNAHHP
jgi:hypothetical protein